MLNLDDFLNERFSFYRRWPVVWPNQQYFPLALYLNKQIKTRFMVRQSDRAVKHASYADYLFMVSAEAGVPTRCPTATRVFPSRPGFFFLKRLSDFCASLDFIHEGCFVSRLYDVSGFITMETYVYVAPAVGEIRS